MGKNSLILYYDFEEQTAAFTDAQVGRLLRMLLAYEKRGEILEDEAPEITMAFLFLKPGLDSNRAKYEKICQRNRQNRNKGGSALPVGTSGTDTEPEYEPEGRGNFSLKEDAWRGSGAGDGKGIGRW